ncbi:MAG: HAD family hydrolase [Candidatus Neomarinimicrobiota bacterium]
MKIKLIIFDLDGTLIDTLSDIEHIFNYVLIQNGYEERSKSFYKNNIGNGFENLLRNCLPDYFEGDFDFLANSVRERYESHLNTKTIVFDGITTVLEHLKKNKVKIAVISNKLHSLAVRSVETYFNLYQMKVIGAEGGFPRKPSPDSTFHMLQHFNCSASDALFVGDSIVDIKTAQSANISSVGVLWGNGTEEDFKKQKSDFILESPLEILDIL